MKAYQVSIAILVALIVIIGGLFATPVIFAQRAMPGMYLGWRNISGTSADDLPGVITAYGKEIVNESIPLTLRGESNEYTLGELGVTVDVDATMEGIKQASRRYIWPRVTRIQPVLTVEAQQAHEQLHARFGDAMTLAQNATIELTSSGQMRVVPSKEGEQVDLKVLQQQLQKYISSEKPEAVVLHVVDAPAPILDSEIEGARTLAAKLIRDGMKLSFEDKEYDVKPFTVLRLLQFQEQTDPWNKENTILGVRFEPTELRSYLEKTIMPEVSQEAVDARFVLQNDEIVEGQSRKVEQFAVAKRGQALDIDKTVEAFAASLADFRTTGALVVTITEPAIQDNTTIESLGITKLLAAGESNFVGSPKNRVHNIRTGAEKYHGLLISPGEEFSFNKYLGPVDAVNGFKPELVIKNNVTTPEFGGGLCQVSTTAFRAAVFSGLEVTTRRNHSYAVSYYGTPGFDATIYPPYTDLRFLNNTPGYILIQTRIEGTKLFFEFWGTDDGRKVEVAGPTPYNRQPDGAVKATVKQTVHTADGSVLIDDTFYSNYKSPKLFPKVLSANGEKPPAPEVVPATNEVKEQDGNQDKPASVTPAASASPNP